MRNFFHTQRLWKGGPFLHFLVLLERYQEFREFARAHRDTLDRYCVGVIPEEWLHCTIQPFFTPVAPGEMRRLIAVTRQQLAHLPPFVVQLGPSYVGRSAVLVAIYPEHGMAELHHRVRTAAEMVGIAMRPARPRFWPHSTLAYGRTSPNGEQRWDSDQLARDLVDLRPERLTITVDRVHLVIEQQHPDVGYYTWSVLEEFRLGEDASSCYTAEADPDLTTSHGEEGRSTSPSGPSRDTARGIQHST